MKGNAKECQGNVRERMQIARGMQGNARGMYGSGCKVTGECKGNVCESKVPKECRGMTESTRVGVKC